VNVAERDDGIPELRIEYSDEDPIAFRAYFDPPDPGPDGSQTLRILVRHAAVKQILHKDLSGQDSVEWLTLLPEIVCDAMVRRLMGKKHPISEEIDAPSLYRDHAEWHMKLLPKVQRLVLALAGAERIGFSGTAPGRGAEAEGDAGSSARERGPVTASTIALAAKRTERSLRVPNPQAHGQMSLDDD
jgi:hypothetical protein